SQIDERDSLPDAVTMVKDLAKDHESVAKRLHALTETAEAEKDPVTADLANARSAFHEKAAWMLRATAK
ncbi:DNA starvation/stationary phase protection protein, partial [Thioclava sp. BHET1]